jgi:hypothetical protein
MYYVRPLCGGEMTTTDWWTFYEPLCGGEMTTTDGLSMTGKTC